MQRGHSTRLPLASSGEQAAVDGTAAEADTKHVNPQVAAFTRQMQLRAARDQQGPRVADAAAHIAEPAVSVPASSAAAARSSDASVARSVKPATRDVRTLMAVHYADAEVPPSVTGAARTVTASGPAVTAARSSPVAEPRQRSAPPLSTRSKLAASFASVGGAPAQQSKRLTSEAAHTPVDRPGSASAVAKSAARTRSFDNLAASARTLLVPGTLDRPGRKTVASPLHPSPMHAYRRGFGAAAQAAPPVGSVRTGYVAAYEDDERSIDVADGRRSSSSSSHAMSPSTGTGRLEAHALQWEATRAMTMPGSAASSITQDMSLDVGSHVPDSALYRSQLMPSLRSARRPASAGPLTSRAQHRDVGAPDVRGQAGNTLRRRIFADTVDMDVVHDELRSDAATQLSELDFVSANPQYAPAKALGSSAVRRVPAPAGMLEADRVPALASHLAPSRPVQRDALRPRQVVDVPVARGAHHPVPEHVSLQTAAEMHMLRRATKATPHKVSGAFSAGAPASHLQQASKPQPPAPVAALSPTRVTESLAPIRQIAEAVQAANFIGPTLRAKMQEVSSRAPSTAEFGTGVGHGMDAVLPGSDDVLVEQEQQTLSTDMPITSSAATARFAPRTPAMGLPAVSKDVKATRHSVALRLMSPALDSTVGDAASAKGSLASAQSSPGVHCPFRLITVPPTAIGAKTKVRVQLCNTSRLSLKAHVRLLPSGASSDVSAFSIKKAHSSFELRPQSFIMLPVVFSPLSDGEAEAILHVTADRPESVDADHLPSESGALRLLCLAKLSGTTMAATS